jgi:hypothetical protein
MSRRSRGAAALVAAVFILAAFVEDGAARGGGRGGGGGFRGGGGFSRSGPAARGSFGRQPARASQRGRYDRRAADGRLGERHDERQQRREERRDERDGAWEDHVEDGWDGREEWEDHIEDDRDDDDGGYYYDSGVVYWSLPCRPNVIAMGGVVYYVCDSVWYTRAYSEGEVVYTEVPNPTGH